MAQVATRNHRLIPWYIGIAITFAAVTFVGYRMWATACPAPMLLEIGVLTIIPLILYR